MSETGSAGKAAIAFLICAILALIYCIPTFVAISRVHPNSTAITALNFVGGWTFLGWVVSLVWAMAKFKDVALPVGSGTPPAIDLPLTGVSNSLTTEIQRLVALKESGVLSETEFIAAKTKLLS